MVILLFGSNKTSVLPWLYQVFVGTLLSSRATTETDYWLPLNPDLAKICQQNACKRLWIGLEIDIKKKLHFLSPNHTSKFMHSCK